MGFKAHQGKRSGKVNELGSLSMQVCKGVTEGQVKEGSNFKRSKGSKVTDLPVAI